MGQIRWMCAVVVTACAVVFGGVGGAAALPGDPPYIDVANGTIDNEGCEDAPELFVGHVAIRLSPAADQSFTISWITRPGTADAPADFIAVSSGQIDVRAGQAAVSADVQIRKDMVREPDETFTVVLTGTTDGTLRNTVATITIHDRACSAGH